MSRVAIATLIIDQNSGPAATSGDLIDFTNNVIELTEKLDIPIELKLSHF
ncbi:hypothetical protein [Leptothoe spongobia]|uniref:Uncharacterized protein n=1 Tax=Leptothoe spongobia TAU-MAC 1115 TaxID=1967444 RepID=A0A947GNH9_9CYAN|nr:hypothetical protein [Leptothoe spongobia]MBT9316046.1 hypothetical protein [Leptothoe spongobia TAU-MAC 1115]